MAEETFNGAVDSPAADRAAAGHGGPQRRVRLALGLIIGLCGLFDVAVSICESARSDFIFGYILGGLLTGAFLAQVGLLAAWAALGRERIFSRLPKTIGLLALVGLTETIGETTGAVQGPPSGDFFVLAGTEFVVVWVVLAAFRWWFGWRIGVGTPPRKGSSTGRAQFTIRDLLVWTVAAALVLGWGVWVLPNLPGEGPNLPFLALAIGVPCTLLVVPSVRFALGERRRKLFLAWLVVVWAAIPCVFAVLIRDYAVTAFEIAGSIATGVCVLTVGSLLVLRRSGVRLRRRGKDEPRPPAVAPSEE